MFVQSEKFVEDHQGKISDISVYGQESNQTTWRLAKMNLAIREIDSSQVKWNAEGSFMNDAHKDLKADYIIANPPFNLSDWDGDLIASTYHDWRNIGGAYEDVAGFCASVPVSKVVELDYVLTPSGGKKIK